MATLSLTVADVRELDHGGGVGHGNLPVTAGNSFSWQPVIIGKIQPASFGLFLPSLFAIPVSLFAGPVSLFALYYSHSGFSQDFVKKMSLSMSVLFAGSFCRSLISRTDGNRIQK